MEVYTACVFVIAMLANADQDMRIVDLTHAQNIEAIYWPGNPSYNFTIFSRGQNAVGGFWYESNSFATAEHGGTHLDAPAHFYENRSRTHQIPMEKLVGRGVIINVKTKASRNPDYRVTVDDLQNWEAKYGRIPNGAVVVMNSGWHQKYPNKTKVFGTESTTDPANFHFPGFHEKAADWLVKHRNIHVLGVDTPSIDYGQSKTFPVHVILGRADIPALENAANLNAIPEFGSIISVAVIKLEDGSGGPARVFAMLQASQTNDCFIAHLNIRLLFIPIVILHVHLSKLTYETKHLPV
ncbi:isatin hydrolase-like [Dreissena polymorpha]|uniref:Cyclase n=1 Tax=Dreissena polymorpha TaxID=45954 RepID=A0A9D4GVV6_DREPO|nr:isatin hydrolase-like [Dreissena polymorpha]XP_052286352.1 isatin hydrolase-like [Dreissena polymorpha]KAH3824671.1 hypothetical protein DPMN_126512 [Dreissena polymorpha]